MSKKILLAAGGTGGHIYPALALARELKKKGCEVYFVVKKNDASLELLDKEKFKHYELNISGFPRKISPKLILFFLKLATSFISSIRIIRRVNPDAVVGLGGYVSFMPALAGKLFNKPLFIHEQNMLPGIANRILSRMADKVAVSFSDAQKYFKGRNTVFTGSPVREEILNIQRAEAFSKFKFIKGNFTIFIFGGSQGAHGINAILISALPLLESYKDKIQFIHISGKKDFELVKKEYENRKFTSAVAPYMYDIGNAYAASDLVICRAGAMTITELIAWKKPAVLVPLPHAAENHQEYNARYLESYNAAVVVEEKKFSPEVFVDLINGFLKAPEKIAKMSDAYKNIPLIKNSSEIFAGMIIEEIKPSTDLALLSSTKFTFCQLDDNLSRNL